MPSSPCPAGHVGSGASGCCNDDGTVDCSGATEAAAATGCSVGDVEACLNGGVCAPNALGENVCNCPVHFEARYRYFSTAVALSASLTWGVHVPLLQGARCEVDKCASQVSGTHAGLIVGQDLCSGAGCHAYGSLLVVVEFRTRCRRVERTAATTLWQPFAAVTAQAPVFWCHFLDSWRQDGENSETTAEK